MIILARPYVFFGASMFISLFIFSYLGIPAAAAVLFIAVIIALPSFFLLRKHKICKILLCICAAVIFSATSFSAKTIYEYYPAISLCDEEKHTVCGEITEYYSQYGNYCYILDNVVIDGNEISHKIRISTSKYTHSDIDDTVTLTNAAVYELGSTDSAVLSYKADGVYIGAYTDSQWQITPAGDRSVKYYLQEMRNRITEILNANMYSQYAAVANALLTGEQSDIDDETLLNFRFSGVSHLFAVSGFHLSLWSSLIAAALSENLKKHRIISNCILISFVIFFMALTGFSKSVVRAGIMLMILFTGKITKFKADSLNSLFIALTFILAANPYAVKSLSLQLSFLATLGIIILSVPVTEPLNKIKQKIKQPALYKIISVCYTTIAISVVATVFTMPVSAINFGYYSPFSPVANLLCVWAAQLIMPLSGFAAMISKIDFLAKPVFVICNFLSKYLITVTEKIAENPLLITETDNIFTLLHVMLILLITAVCLILCRNSNKKLRRCVACSMAALLCVSVYSASLKKSSCEITVADVGNGTAVIAYINGYSAIIGCGGGVTSDYKFTSQADKENSRSFDLLLIPRNEKTESRYALQALEKYTFNKCILADGDFDSEMIKKLPENTVISSSCALSLDENSSLIYINNSDFSGVMIKSANFKCVILFRPTSDFSTVAKDWQSADLLITRRNLPQTDISRFDTIIVSTSSDTVYPNENIHTTEHEQSLTYTKFPWGGVTLNAAK